MRPWEALLRDPWWVFTTWKLIDAIKKTYGFKFWTLVLINRRFGVMLLCMFLSVVFLVTDVAVSAAKITANSGINPYWRFALVFKCASDTIFLDDFKSVLDDIVARKFSSAHDTVHRGSIAYSRTGGRKRSRSVSRGEQHVDCSELESQTGTLTQVQSIAPQPISKRPKFLHPFSRARKPLVPEIQVHQDIALTSKSRNTSYDSHCSDSPVLPRPTCAVYPSRNSMASRSDGSLLIGRLV